MNCVECGKETTNPKFCSRSCSVKYNNRNRFPERQSPKICQCGKRIEQTSAKCRDCHLVELSNKPKKVNVCIKCNEKETRSQKAKYCDECRKLHKNKKTKLCKCGKIISARFRYCEECYETSKTEHNVDKCEIYCPTCEKTKPASEFYRNGNSSYNYGYCKECSNKYVKEQFRKIKEECVTYKGGKCEVCGYCKCLQALDFHHRDPSQKDFLISSHRSTKMTESLRMELDKCDLLCANCHREAHYLLGIE